MTITVTIEAENSAQAREEMMALINQRPSDYAPTAPVMAEASNEAPAAETKPAVVEAEKPKRTTGRKPATAPVVETVEVVAAKPETTEQGDFTRADLTETIKEVHTKHGDGVLPKIKAVIMQFDAIPGHAKPTAPNGKANSQSQVKDEDLKAVITQIKELL